MVDRLLRVLFLDFKQFDQRFDCRTLQIEYGLGKNSQSLVYLNENGKQNDGDGGHDERWLAGHVIAQRCRQTVRDRTAETTVRHDHLNDVEIYKISGQTLSTIWNLLVLNLLMKCVCTHTPIIRMTNVKNTTDPTNAQSMVDTIGLSSSSTLTKM